MKTPLATLLAMLVVQAAASSQLVVPDAPDLMIKTRRTIDRPGTAVTTEILYLKGARQRREILVEAPSHAGTGAGTLSTSTWIHITQCDERRMLFLYPQARTYTHQRIEDRARSGEITMGPTAITIDAVDTGERRRLTHYVARHVITTRTIAPAPGAGARATVHRQDGWYVNVPAANCAEPAPGEYPIEETHRFSGPEDAAAMGTQLVELSEAPLDDALFTIPDGYRPALRHPDGHYDPTKPDTLMNRLDAYREVVVAWTDYVRRYGLRAIVWGTRPSPGY